MPKSSKKSKGGASSAEAPAESISEAAGETPVAPTSKKRTAKATVAGKKSVRKSTGAGSRKTTAETRPRQSAARKKAAPSQVAVSDDDIRLRAYFLAEERIRKGIQGDSAHDWLDARRQLLAEAAGRA